MAFCSTGGVLSNVPVLDQFKFWLLVLYLGVLVFRFQMFAIGLWTSILMSVKQIKTSKTIGGAILVNSNTEFSKVRKEAGTYYKSLW